REEEERPPTITATTRRNPPPPARRQRPQQKRRPPPSPRQKRPRKNRPNRQSNSGFQLSTKTPSATDGVFFSGGRLVLSALKYSPGGSSCEDRCRNRRENGLRSDSIPSNPLGTSDRKPPRATPASRRAGSALGW